MKRKHSPVLKSLKCSLQNLKSGCSNESGIHSQNVCNGDQQSLAGATSRSSSQESNLTTQNTQSFRRRLEKNFSEHPPLPKNLSEAKTNPCEISLDLCSPSNVDRGPFFGLPSKVKEILFASKNIKSLYEWQEKCLEATITGKNLLISLPTSSGKTLVAEIMMLRKLLLNQNDVLFVLPYVSLVQEKVRSLCSLAVDLNFVVDEYAGSKGFYPPKKRRKRNTIYVATLEKADSLIESFLETGRITELGLIVIDEVHMISETGGRGAKLENAITKLKHFASSIQLIAMSATVGNLDELASFLRATLFHGGFRPVPLIQYLKVENEMVIFNSKAQAEEDRFETVSHNFCNNPKKASKNDHDNLTQIVEEIIPEHSCLIFCPTRRNTEAVAKLLCQCLPKNLHDWQKQAKVSLMITLKEEGSGKICPILRKTVPYGVTYHHAGLTEGERKLVEEAFISGTLCCIVCTSTLAAGINLPARRVIIRAPYVGNNLITKSRYSQMIGRAGRAGLDSLGESFMIVSAKDVQKVRDVLVAPIEKCTSRMMENEWNGLTNLLFSMIGLQMVKSTSAALSLVQDTLLALQAESLGISVHAEVFSVLEKLRAAGMLRCARDSKQDLRRSPRSSKQLKTGTSDEALKVPKLINNDRLIICRVGKAAIKGSIELCWANRLYHDLMNARAKLVVHSHLHLLYLVIPYQSTDGFSCNPLTFFDVYNGLSDEDREIASVLGITEARAVIIRRGQQPKDLDQLVVRRFCLALLLHNLQSGTDIWELSDLYKVDRGLIQRIFSATVSFAYGVLYFCDELQELWAFKDLLLTFTKTLSICSYSEITPLLSLPAVKFGRAKLLYKAGFKSLADIAKATPKQLTEKTQHLSGNVARQIISSAKMLLLEKANDLQEEAEELFVNMTAPSKS